MLTLTENAQTAIKTLTSEAGLPEDGGVRIAMADGGSELQMALSPEPGVGGDLGHDVGARAFVAEETAPMLDAQELDATETEQGTGFSLRKQV